MKLEKQNIGVWVKATEELPDKAGKYWIRYTNYKGLQLTGSLFDGFKFPHHQGFTEWLKPFEQVYVLTEDELEEVIKDAIRSTGTFLREDLNPEFLKTIDNIEKAINKNQ